MQGRGALEQVGIGNGLARGGITMHGRADQHVAIHGKIRCRGNIFRCKPTLQNIFRDRFDAVVSDHRNALCPHIRRPDLGCRIRQDQQFDQIRSLCRKSLCDQATDRQAANGGGFQAQMIHESRKVVHVFLHAPTAFRTIGQAMSAFVIAQYTITIAQGGLYRIPNSEIRAQGVGKHKRGSLFRPREAVMQRDRIDLCNFQLRSPEVDLQEPENSYS